MPKIKFKENIPKKIKMLDKSLILAERTKDALLNIKDKFESNINEEENINSFANRENDFFINRSFDELIYNFNKRGKNCFYQIKNKLKNRRINKLYGNNSSKDINNKKNEIIKKSVENYKKNKIKKNIIINNKNRNVNLKKTINNTKKYIKEIIRHTKDLFTLIVAGGWISIIIIILICCLGIIFSSPLGIFFSSESTQNSVTMSSVINNINNNMAEKISDIQKNNDFDDINIISKSARWEEILALYVVRISNGNNQTDVITLNDEKIKVLEDTFWKINSIKSYVSVEELEGKQKRILNINISSKTIEDMKKEFNFSNKQIKQLNELLNEDFYNLWSYAIYGSNINNSNVIKLALSQVGNIGGEIYWSWYGFENHVDWCACFVSWVFNEVGYIDKNIVPKFASCKNGVNWFKAVGKWKTKEYIPKSGDIIFFDWELDGTANHVGIVEKISNDKIYTIEGNSQDMCKRNSYNINSNLIYGYGIVK